MISTINNSQKTNQNNITRFAKSGVSRHSLRCDQKPFCTKINSVSFVSQNNKIYINKNIFVVTRNTSKNQYPNSNLFGKENTTQNIYSADPQKLRIGVY